MLEPGADIDGDTCDTNPAVLKRLAPALTVVLLAAGCSKPQFDVRAFEHDGPVWFPQVVAFEENAGVGLSIDTDAEGNPHTAFLLLDEPLKPGEEPPPPDPLAPVLPAVGHAHLAEDIWTHSEVVESQAEPKKPLGLTDQDETAIAVDAEGGHHIAWTDGGELYYSNDPTGESEPQRVGSTDAEGLSITTDESGAPWIAFYEVQDEAEGPGALVRVATLDGERWNVDTAAEADAFDPISTGIGAGPDGAMVAYGSSNGTNLARLQGSAWRSEVADPDGGVGVSMDLDSDGNPHLAYITPEGQVRHAHSVEGGDWEVSDVGAGTAIAATSISLDPEGVHHIAWQRDVDLAYANNAEGEFAEVQLPGATAGGQRPRLAAGPAGVFLAWYSATGSRLQMATYSEDEPLLAVPSPPPGPGGEPAGACAPEGDQLSIVASGLAFDKDCLAVEAGQPFSIEFDNQDAGTPHNVAIYTEPPPPGETLFQGEVFPGVAAQTYEVDPLPDPGEFFFQCDVHPTMAGTFLVA